MWVRILGRESKITFMFSMMGYVPGLSDVDMEDTVEKPDWDDDVIVVGDIVEVATLYGQPALSRSENFDTKAQLRVLGAAQGDRTVYIMLVTDADTKHILPNTRVDKRMAKEFGIESRFIGELAIAISDLHTRRIVKQQRGRWCEKCDEYSEDVRTEYTEIYFCYACRENPCR